MALHRLTVTAPMGPRSVRPLGKTQTEPPETPQQSGLPEAQQLSLLPLSQQSTNAVNCRAASPAVLE